MNGQKTNSSVGGRSLIGLLVPYMATVSASDSNYATTQLQYLSEQVPDLRFIYYRFYSGLYCYKLDAAMVNHSNTKQRNLRYR